MSDYNGELPPEHEEETRQIVEQCSREIRERLAVLDDQFKLRIDSCFNDIGDSYKQHASVHIQNRQTDVLRANKVIREVSRELGSDWKFVLQSLLAGFPMDVINSEIEQIERQRPYMQPYRALVRWRDLKGENFNIKDLVDILKTCCKDELAARAQMILHCGEDELIAMGNGPIGIASGLGEDETSAAEATVADRNLLQVARKLDKDWFQVGTCLDLPAEELDEIKSAEGDSYKAAFRMLWLWRDMAGKAGQDTPGALGDALRSAGRDDLYDIIQEQ